MDTPDYIFRASIRLRDGRRIYAQNFGLKAFKIRVRHDPPPEPKLPGLK